MYKLLVILIIHNVDKKKGKLIRTKRGLLNKHIHSLSYHIPLLSRTKIERRECKEGEVGPCSSSNTRYQRSISNQYNLFHIGTGPRERSV